MAYSRLTNTAIGTNSDYYLRLYWEETVNVAANKSVVNVRLCGYTDRSKGICSFNQYGTNSIKITIDGTESTLTGQNIDTRDWSGSEKVLHTASKEITHNNDGTKSIAISGSIVYQGGGSSLVAGTYTTSVSSQALTTIARASTVGTVSNTAITSSSGNVTINISKKNSAYYDKITTTGAISKTINVGTGTSGTISWSDLLAAMPSTSSATLNITVSTYSNSGYTTLIGSNTGKATITINTSNIKPSISWGSIAVNSGGLSGKLVAGKSTAKATWTVTNATGASVSSVTVSATNGSISSGASSTSTSGTPVTAVLPSNTSNYNLTLTATVKDSRGATATATTSAATVYGYAPPNLTLTAYRTATNSSTTQDPTGAYVYTTWSASVGASVGSSNAIASTTKTPSSITSGGYYSLATNATQAFTVTVTDTVGSSTSKTVNIGTALIPFDLYSNAAGTAVGVGIGEAARSGRLDCALPAYFKGMIYDAQTAMIGLNASSDGVGWYLVTSGTATGYADVGLTFLFSEGYSPRGIGIYTVNFRCDNGSSLSISRNGWLVRTGAFNVGDVKAYTSGNDWYIYIYKGNTYGQIHARILSSTGTAGWRAHLMQNNTTVLSSASGTAATDIGITGTASAGDSNAVKLTGAQTIAGAKTFTTSPTAPAIELSYSTPYIDFHYGNSTADYTSRIIESSSGVLDIKASNGIKFNAGALPIASGGTGATSAANARVNLGVNQPVTTDAITIAGNSTGTFNNITTANYKFFSFKFVANNVATILLLTIDQFLSSQQSYWINDGTTSGMEIKLTRNTSSVSINRPGSSSVTCRLTYWT